MMGPVDRLLKLAGRRSHDERAALLRAIADMFFASAERSTTETALFDDILDLVLEEVEPVARRELAERLAAMDAPPRRTLLRLAGDEIDVAESLLTNSPALGDDDLVPIAKRRSEPHLLAIARRRLLSERVTDVLVSHGNDNVAGALAGNDGARMSDDGFAILARHAVANDNVLDLLIMRRDLPDKVATELLPVLAASMHARLENLDVGIPVAAACDLVGEARSLLAARLRASATPSRPLEVLVRLIDRGDLSFAAAVVELADADHIVDVAALFARRLKLGSDIVVSNLFGTDVTLTMLICRAAGLDVNAFSATLRLRNRRRRDHAAPGAVLKDYLAVPPDLAAKVIQSVRTRERDG
ncbi:DUF2336 domain-containing protein [Xanthobacteraceae bacterium Astr-EGSB]|uniref:DUF2336 domain-containing protein n=1 Tax=Astrobacterium formosum TaxID=3069710 RepID=UPI0027B03BA0|nr:DUF2336 domain-containing protein [Xanthobacteraceae bacterium Astr-EGSB]